jgi:hypothetical protein
MVGAALHLVNARLGRRVFVWGALLAVLAVALQAVPLFDLLGFDYAFALTLVVALAASDVGAGAAQAARREGQPTLGRTLPAAWAGALALLVLPLLVSLANAARVRNCSIGAGLAFFLLLPVATAAIAATSGALAGLALPRRGRLLAWGIPLASVAWSLLRLYVDPAVFAFDPFGGYFPGPIYDEALRPPQRLVFYRAANALWAATAIAVFWANERRGSKVRILTTIALVAASTGVFAARGRLGFHVRAVDLLRALSREDRSPHFVVHGDPHDGASAAERALLLDDLEFRYAQLSRVLGVQPPGRVTVWNFPSAEAKKRLVGAANTLYAKPWTREIFVQADRFPAPRLRHELAHVFAAGFGDPLFGVSLRYLPWPRLASGLVEGLAEAADYGDPDGRATVHQDARAIVDDGLAPPLASIVGAGFSTASGARAYTLAGSFVHFLLSRYGADRARALYRSAGDFSGVYGKPLDELEREWRAFLQAQPEIADERAAARERYRRPAIFQRVCARELAARVSEARGLVGEDPARALALAQSACSDDPHEPTFRLELAELRAAAGLSDEALASARALARDDELTRPLRARAAALEAALAFGTGRLDEAAAAVEATLVLATDEGSKRTALARRRALADPEARATLGRVLFANGPGAPDGALVMHLLDRFAARFPGEALGPYLLARQLASRDERLALERLRVACPATGPTLPVPLAAPFDKECRRLTGELAYRTGDLGAARASYERLRTDAETEAERLTAQDFLDRNTWKQTGALPPR